MGISVAIRAFFAALFHRDAAHKIQLALSNDVAVTPQQLPAPSYPDAFPTRGSSTQTDVRSEAIELLAALQRDARFVDFIKEDLSSCDDATLGAAARMVHDRCSETLERFFEIRPLSDDEEGAFITLDSTSQNPARVRVSGDIDRLTDGAVSCRVVHVGWVAKKCEPPQWSGKAEDALVLAPIELEIA